MNHNPYFYERLANDKLSALRAEGLRSQMFAQAGLQHSRQPLFSDLRQFFVRMLVRVASPQPAADQKGWQPQSTSEAGC